MVWRELPVFIDFVRKPEVVFERKYVCGNADARVDFSCRIDKCRRISVENPVDRKIERDRDN